MGKKLSELTLEELWQLFPIILTEHKDYWKEWYREEESLLKIIIYPEYYKNKSYRKYCHKWNMGKAYNRYPY